VDSDDDMEYTEDAIDNIILELIKISSYHNKSNNITSVQSSRLTFYSGPVSSNIYRPTINYTGPNLKITLMTINSNHQNSKHDGKYRHMERFFYIGKHLSYNDVLR
jgi:hypothetical protein